MSKCLCCNKEISESATTYEKNTGWHKRCIKKFFNRNSLPSIEINKENLEAIAKTAINSGFTVPGVQKKISLHLSQEKENRLTIVGYPTGYILKPQTNEFNNLPEMEHLIMTMADSVKIKTVPHALYKINDEYAYITKRIDRNFENTLFAMEDFCQLSQRVTYEKYKSSYEQCSKVIKKYSIQPKLDLSELFYRLLFCFVTGNSDMHLKNFSLIETNPGNRDFILSPAYDLLPVNVVMPEDLEETALTLNGKKSNIHKKDFLAFAQNCGINQNAAEKMINKILSYKENLIDLCNSTYVPSNYQEKLKELITNRFHSLI